MPSQAPKIDPRDYQQFVARVTQLAEQYSGWRPRADGAPDGGVALIGVFARMVELLVERVNRVPEKNFLAFLELIGTQIMPPQPARVPLTFSLAAGAADDTLVPAQTQVAATPIRGDPGPVVFETEDDLLVTRSQLAAIYVREPGRDRYSGNLLASAPPFPAFEGAHAATHRILLGHTRQFGLDAASKAITLRFTPAVGAVAWLTALRWMYWDGERYLPLAQSAPRLEGGGWELTFPGVPAIPLSGPRPSGAENAPEVAQRSAWLVGELIPALPRNVQIEQLATPPRSVPWRSGLLPDALFADSEKLPLNASLHPFGAASLRTSFYLASEEAFASGAPLQLDVRLDPAHQAQPTGELELAWEHWSGASWQELGRSRPRATAPRPTPQGFVDETRALTRDGSLSFVAPASWPSLTLNGEGVARRWLRARIVAGSYKSPAGYRPPVISSLTLTYGDLLRVSTVQTRVIAVEQGLAPELAAADQLPVDLSKDFFPFGERPRFNATLYLANERAFSKPGAKVRLTISLTNPKDEKLTPLPAVANGALLAWEYWDSKTRSWQDLRPDDQSASFTKDRASVTFVIPPTIGALEVNGERRTWLRVRLARGNYGSEARYEPLLKANGEPEIDERTKLPIYKLTPADFRPPSIKQLTIDYDYTSGFEPLEYVLTENDFTVEDVSAAAATVPGGTGDDQPFLPFVPMQASAWPALYLGFQRPGATSGFANRSSSLFVSVADALYGEAIGAGAERAAVTWEYWNGQRWARLGTRDETQGFFRRGLVTFVGPGDFPARADFGLGERLFWLRAVWERGSYAVLPQLTRVLTNTTWAANQLTIANELLGSSIGEPGQLFRATHTPLLAGQVVEVREPEQPSAEEYALLAADEGPDAVSVTPALDGRASEVWVRWHETPDFYGSQPRSRHYTLDRQTGELRFGDGLFGLIPPRGRVNIRLTRYQTGGGLAGNRPAGNITQLKTTVPLVDRVTNLEPASGGAEQEQLEAVLRRGPRTLRHGGRAVAVADFEDLALLASPDVALVHGIPALGPQDAGAIQLIVVPRSAAARPVPSLELLARVQAYVEARMLATAELRVQGPDWLQVSISAEVVPTSFEHANDVQTAVLARLASFLHPLTGGLDGQGWAFGRKPYRSDLFALVERTPGVSHVRRLQVDELPDGGAVRPDRLLVYSGNHQIVMAGAASASEI